MKIQKTKNYGQFNQVVSNREVHEGHVKKLVASIKDKNLLATNPIIVNEKMQVIDGQHRLAAAEQLELPIYYLVSNEINKADISRLNSVSKNWSLTDYLNFYAVEGVPEYLRLSKFINRFSKFKVTTAIILLNRELVRDTRGFKEGKLVVDNEKQAYQLAEQLQCFEVFGYDFIYSRNFVMALFRCNRVNGFDFNYLFNKVSNYRLKFFTCVNEGQYIDMIASLYNFRSSANRLDFSTIIK